MLDHPAPATSLAAGLLIALAILAGPVGAEPTPMPSAGLPARVSDGCATEHGALLHGPRSSGLIALTFDACPTTHVPGFSPDIVDQLEAGGIPATFFISGRWAEAHPQELARLAGVPFFEIGSHGYRHRHLRAGALDAAINEIDDGRAALERAGVTVQPLFRPPYGDRPPLLVDAARRTGVTPVLWDVAPGDPDPHVTARDIEHTVLARARGGSIIVLHVNGRGVATAAALPSIIAGLQQRGLRFTTVSALVRQCNELDANH